LYFVITITNFPDLIAENNITEILNTINFGILYLIDVTLPLFLTILQFIISLFVEGEIEESVLDQVLRDPKGHDLIAEFCKMEYSVENVYAWDDIEAYKRVEKDDPAFKSLTDSQQRKLLLITHARRILSKYFAGGKSLMEVNCQQKDIDTILKKIQLKQVDRHLFDKLLETVSMNLCDSFSRFCLTSQYKKFLAEKVLVNVLMEKEQKLGKALKAWINFRRNVVKTARQRAASVKEFFSLGHSTNPTSDAVEFETTEQVSQPSAITGAQLEVVQVEPSQTPQSPSTISSHNVDAINISNEF